MKRYRAIANRYPAMEEHPQGIWVHFWEVKALYAALLKIQDSPNDSDFVYRTASRALDASPSSEGGS